MQVKLTEEDIRGLSLRHIPEYVNNLRLKPVDTSNSFKNQQGPVLSPTGQPSNSNIEPVGDQPMAILTNNSETSSDEDDITRTNGDTAEPVRDKAEISLRIVNDTDHSSSDASAGDIS